MSTVKTNQRITNGIEFSHLIAPPDCSVERRGQLFTVRNENIFGEECEVLALSTTDIQALSLIRNPRMYKFHGLFHRHRII